MGKTSNQFGSAKMGFFMHLAVAIVLVAIAFGLILGTIHVSNQMVKAILTLVCVAVLVYLTFNIAGFWRSWRSGNGTTTARATTAASATIPVAPATTPVAPATTPVAPATATAAPTTTSAAPTIAPATPAPTPAAPKKITRAYLQQQAAVVDDRMVEAEEVCEAAEKLQDEYKAAKSDYEQKLAKANARRLPPQQP